MDRGRPPPPRENNYRPGERYGGRSPPQPPRRARSPPGGDRTFPVRRGPTYSRDNSPGRPPRHRSRSPYHSRDDRQRDDRLRDDRPARDGPGAFRPRSPLRGPGRPRSPPPRRFSRSPPRGPPGRRPSPSTYRPRSPPPRDGRYTGPGRDDRRDFDRPREDTSRYSRENSYRPRDGSPSPVRGSGPASKVVSADSSRMPSPHIHADRLRQNISESPAPGGSPIHYNSRAPMPPRRSPPPYRGRDRSPPPPRSPRQPYRDRPPVPRGSPRRTSPPSKRDYSPPSRASQRERSPPKGPAGDRPSYRENPPVPQEDNKDVVMRTAGHGEPTSSWGDRAPPAGPRMRDDESRMPPSGPRSSQYERPGRDNVPPTGPSAPSGPAAMSRGSPFAARGRGGPLFGRGRGSDSYTLAPSFGRGRARGGFSSSTSEISGRELSGPPTGPRNPGWGDSGSSVPPSGPSLRSSLTLSNTYPRAQRFYNYLAGITQIVEGGRKLPSMLNPGDEKRLAMLDSEKEKLYKDIDEKQRRRRILENEYAKVERDAAGARLRTELAEQALERLGGEGGAATAY